MEPWWLTCARTAAWVVGVGLASTVVAMLAAPRIRAASVKWWVIVLGALVPPFTTWFGIWSLLAPDRVLGSMIAPAGGGPAESSRPAALAVALTVWGGSLATLVCVWWDQRADHDDVATLDGARGWRRVLLDAHRLAVGAAVGGLMVSLVLLGESTAFDLAQVRTIPFELRSLVALRTPAEEVILLAVPLLAVAAAGAILLSVVGVRWLARRAATATGRNGACRDGASGWILPIGVLAAVAPVLWLAVAWNDAEPLRAEHVHGLVRSAAEAGVAGCAVAVGAMACFVWIVVRPRPTWLLMAASAIAMLSLAIPAALVALACHAIGHEWMALLAGHVIRVGGLAWIGAMLAAAAQPQESVDAARLRGGAMAVACAIRPAAWRLGATLFVAGAFLAFTDVSLSSLLEPVGADRLATRLVDALHYQRPGPVILVLPLVVVFVLLAVAVAGVSQLRRRARSLLLCAACGMVFPCAGCGECDEPSADGARAEVIAVHGAPGRAPGCFEMPRALTVDPSDGSFVVIDKTGRVQRFAADGSLIEWWRMPHTEHGMPTGVTVGPDGSIWVADTHEHRVVRFDRSGSLMQVIGKGGTGDGEFIYPTDVAVRSDGRILVSEYGGNDRLQEFGPDGSWIRSIGTRGALDLDGFERERSTGVPQLDRPQAIVLDEAAGRIYVADACHHRVAELDLDGRIVRSIGRPGTAPGELWYPYGVDRLGEHQLVVCEFGANRLQVIDLAGGEAFKTIGGGGVHPGQFATPWAVAVRGGQLLVCDARNGRVQVVQP